MHGELINVLCSKNAALAYYSVLLVLHLIVFLVALYKVDIANAGIFVNLISKHDFVPFYPSNGIAG